MKAGGNIPSTIFPSLLPGFLRTVMPLVYAMLVRWGVVDVIDPDDIFITNALTVMLTSVFYLVLRILERYWDKIGWLLGYPQQPVYVTGAGSDEDRII